MTFRLPVTTTQGGRSTSVAAAAWAMYVAARMTPRFVRADLHLDVALRYLRRDRVSPFVCGAIAHRRYGARAGIDPVGASAWAPAAEGRG